MKIALGNDNPLLSYTRIDPQNTGLAYCILFFEDFGKKHFLDEGWRGGGVLMACVF